MRQGRTGPRGLGDGGIAAASPPDLGERNFVRFSDLNWKVSSRCAGNGACTEVAQLATGHVAVRDGMDPRPNQVIVFDREQWGRFLASVKAGQFGVR